MKPDYQSRYSDLLTDPSDEALDRLVQKLDAAYTGPTRPADLSWGNARQYLALVPPPASTEEASPPVRPWRGRATRGRKGTFVAVAAVVLVTVLCFTLLTLLGTLRFQQNPHTPATSLAADVQLLQQLVQDKGTPAGIGQLVQGGQFTSVNLSSPTYDVHIQQVYIDANNVVLLYTVDQSAWDQACQLLTIDHALHACIKEPVLTLKTSTGQTLTEIAERVDFGKEPAGNNKLVAILAYYDASVIQGNPTQVTLTASLHKTISPSQEKIGAFTAPVHTEKKVMNVHQTVSSRGHALTLERVVITPTEARFYCSFQRPLGNSPDAQVLFGSDALSIAGKTYDPEPFPADSFPAATNGDAYGWFAPGALALPNFTSFYGAFLNATGTWVSTQIATVVENRQSVYSVKIIHYTWKFTFTIS